jgi:hypothetical protein
VCGGSDNIAIFSPIPSCLSMDDKIDVVANDTADGVLALSDTWNAEVNSLFLPCDSTLNIAGKTKTTTDKADGG